RACFGTTSSDDDYKARETFNYADQFIINSVSAIEDYSPARLRVNQTVRSGSKIRHLHQIIFIK
ncbi:MAG: hypothetical protein OSB38_22895, partial [Paraburkholderia fungorum]|nr:hypothetical protein [Paraburkholderia fungorum]